MTALGISRTWEGRVQRARADVYHRYFLRTGLPDYYETPGNGGVLALRRDEGDVSKVVFITCWQDMAAVRAFAGDEPEQARYYAEDAYFLVEQPPQVVHHRILRKPASGFGAHPGGLVRRWHGWADATTADAYEALLLGEVAPGIEARGLDGFGGLLVLRRDLDAASEFVTLMAFRDEAAVVAFAGPDSEQAVVPPAAQRLLTRWDERAEHFTVLPLTIG